MILIEYIMNVWSFVSLSRINYWIDIMKLDNDYAYTSE